MTHPVCKREGCNKLAHPRDEFCSGYCTKLHHGVIKPSTFTAWEKRKISEARQNGPGYVEVENAEAMNRRLPGSFESGKRR